MKERLQKLLSAAGICSRRTGEQYLSDGRITVNGQRAQLGDKADWSCDRICLDGRPLLPPAAAPVTLMLYKPRGYITTLSDEKDRPTVAQLLSRSGLGRLWPVGRLDYDSEGLLLMSSDGALTHALTHPKSGVEKEYRVWVRGDAGAALPALNAPMQLSDGPLLPARVILLGKKGELCQLSFTITQGKNRQIRRMCQAVSLPVVRLKRVREGSLRLDPALSPGQWRLLTAAELTALKAEIPPA